MAEFVKQVSEQATAALREIFGRELLPGEHPILELIDLLLGDGFGEAKSPAAQPITSQLWLDWHHFTLMIPTRLIAAMSAALEREQAKLPCQREAMEIWAVCLILRTLDRLARM